MAATRREGSTVNLYIGRLSVVLVLGCDELSDSSETPCSADAPNSVDSVRRRRVVHTLQPVRRRSSSRDGRSACASSRDSNLMLAARGLIPALFASLAAGWLGCSSPSQSNQVDASISSDGDGGDTGNGACIDECTANAVQCAGPATIQTCVRGPDDCLHFDTPAECAMGETCSLGFCGVHDAWTVVQTMLPTDRYNYGSTAGLDGRIYVLGGRQLVNNQFVFHRTVEAYTPSTNTWERLPDMPTARETVAATTGLDGRIYAISGKDTTLNGAPVRVEAYTPSTKTWETLASLPEALGTSVAVTGTDGRIYLIATDAKAYAYTPSTNSWAPLANMPYTPILPSAVTAADGRIFVVGGSYDQGGMSGRVEVAVFTPATGGWTQVAGMSTGRALPGAAIAADGRLYAIGGYNQGFLKTVEAYDFTTGSWTAATSMPNAGGGKAHVVGNRIYRVGRTQVSYYTP
jgi:hypothetical protein